MPTEQITPMTKPYFPMLLLAREIALGIAKETKVNRIGLAQKNSIDIGVAVLSAVNKTRIPLTLDDIGFVCGCCRERIRQIEFKALRKARGQMRYMESTVHDEMHDEFQHLRHNSAFRKEAQDEQW